MSKKQTDVKKVTSISQARSLAAFHAITKYQLEINWYIDAEGEEEDVPVVSVISMRYGGKYGKQSECLVEAIEDCVKRNKLDKKK